MRGSGPITDTATPATGGTGTVTGSIALSLSTTSVSVNSSVTLAAIASDSAGQRIRFRAMSFSTPTPSDLSFIPASTALTDENGRASITVIVGNKAGAKTINAELTGLFGTTVSGTIDLSVDKPAIATGIPDQDSFSLKASIQNIEGWKVDGVTSDITVRLVDHYNNPVPDGTAVYFRTSGGSIQPSCTTTNGACTVQFTSQAPWPEDNKGCAVVLAYALGEESFIDLNSNGQYDPDIDIFIDMPEPFLDANENSISDPNGLMHPNCVRDDNEEFIDTNSNGLYSLGDLIFNGILRNPSIIGPKTIHISDSLTIVLSGSEAVIKIDGSTSPPARNITACTTAAPFTSGSVSFNVVVADVNGNVMPAGTTISFSTTNGEILTTPTTYVVPSTSTKSLATYPVTIQSDATQSGTSVLYTCTNTKPSGIFTVTVTTPKEISSYQYVTIND